MQQIRMRVSDNVYPVYQISPDSTCFAKIDFEKLSDARNKKIFQFFHRIIGHPWFVKEQLATTLIDRREIIPVGFDDWQWTRLKRKQIAAIHM